jgi:hypothetical protein
MKRLFLLMGLLSFLTGCATRIDLPDVTAARLKAVHNNPWVSVEIEATNLVDHPDKVTADRVIYHRNGRASSGHIEIEGYVRQKKK